MSTKVLKLMKNQKGFTLIELLVVIAILGVLATIALPKYNDSIAVAKGAKIMMDLASIDNAIQQYAATQGIDATTATITATNLDPYFQGGFPSPGTSGTWKTKNNSAPLTPASVYTITSGRAMFGAFNSSTL